MRYFQISTGKIVIRLENIKLSRIYKNNFKDISDLLVVDISSDSFDSTGRGTSITDTVMLFVPGFVLLVVVDVVVGWLVVDVVILVVLTVICDVTIDWLHLLHDFGHFEVMNVRFELQKPIFANIAQSERWSEHVWTVPKRLLRLVLIFAIPF